jgi:hypothetical protein
LTQCHVPQREHVATFGAGDQVAFGGGSVWAETSALVSRLLTRARIRLRCRFTLISVKATRADDHADDV